LAAPHEAGIKPDVGNVQQALYALQEKKLVWRASRGVYAIEEHSITEVLQSAGLLDDLID
jgi:hypothetical protein